MRKEDIKPKVDEAIYLLNYEKEKIKGCSNSFKSLSKILLMPDDTIEIIEDRQEKLWRKRLAENRELLSDHLKEMARIMDQVIEEKVSIHTLDEKVEKELIKVLYQEGIILNEIFIIKRGENVELSIYAKRKDDTKKKQKKINHESFNEKNITIEELAEMLSTYLELNLEANSMSPYFLTDSFQTMYFKEKPLFNVLTGYAVAVKESEKISGDNYTFFENGSEKIYGILSDGMGSGEKAYLDSKTVVDMAEQFIGAGFQIELVVQLINDALIAGAKEKNMSTLDLCEIDLTTGNATFIKIGSAATFIKQDGHVEKIPAQNLPLGIFHKLEMPVIKRQLLDGDYIILISDGMLEDVGEDKEAFLVEYIATLPYKRPNQIASHLMKCMIELNKGRVMDDMTILVIGIWKNNKY